MKEGGSCFVPRKEKGVGDGGRESEVGRGGAGSGAGGGSVGDGAAGMRRDHEAARCGIDGRAGGEGTRRLRPDLTTGSRHHLPFAATAGTPLNAPAFLAPILLDICLNFTFFSSFSSSTRRSKSTPDPSTRGHSLPIHQQLNVFLPTPPALLGLCHLLEVLLSVAADLHQAPCLDHSADFFPILPVQLQALQEQYVFFIGPSTWEGREGGREEVMDGDLSVFVIFPPLH